MTAEALVSLLEAELDASRALAETLEAQRRALLEPEPAVLSALTDRLAGQFGHLSALLQMRWDAAEPAPALDAQEAALLREARLVQARIAGLAQFNQELLADRLAYVGVILGALTPDSTPPGYRAGGSPRRAPGALARSA